MNASAGKRDQGSAPGVASANAAPPAITSGPAPETEGGAGSSQSVDASGPDLSDEESRNIMNAAYRRLLMATERKPRKTMDEKIADLKRREAWKLTRKAEKLEAQASALRKQAAELQAEAGAL